MTSTWLMPLAVAGVVAGGTALWAAEGNGARCEGLCVASTADDAPMRVTLTVEERAGVDRHCWPVTQGVPFARGVLKDAAALTLRDDSGQRVPLAARAIAWWDAEKTSIRFALVDFQVTLAPKAAPRFTLSSGAAAPQPRAAELAVCDAADSLTVTTGGLKATFSKGRPLLWQEVTTGDGAVLHGTDAGTFYLVRQDGTRFAMAAAKKDYRVEVEEANPLRVIVKQQGWCVAAGGETYCRYVMRHYFHAGRPWIHLRPTLIFTGRWPAEWIREFGVELKLASPPRRVRTAVDGKPIDVAVPRAGGVLALQADDQRFTLSSGGPPARTGRRSEGFIAVGEGKRALMVAVRDFWQTHPKAFTVAGDTLTVKLWAAESGRELDFGRMWAVRPMVMMADMPGVLVNQQKGPFKKAFEEQALREALLKLAPGTLVNVRMGAAGSKEMAFLPAEMFRRIHAEFGEKLYFFACDWFPFAEGDAARGQPGRLRDLNTARGHGKTHDLLLAFGATDAAALAAAWAKPVWALAPPSYLCGTGAVGPLRGREPGRFPEFDEALLRAADQAVKNADRFRLNGMWDYGTSINWHNFPGAEYIMDVMGKEPGFRPTTRLGVTDHGSTSPGGGIQRGAWLVAWYTGDPSRFDFALRQTSHLFDVDACHEEFGLAGLRSLGALGGEGVLHWVDWKTIITTCGGVIDHYLFTGDPYALQTLREIAEYTLDVYAERFKDNYERRLYEYTVRADYLCGELMIEYHRLTWDPKAWAMAQDVWQNVQKRPGRGLPVLQENYGPHFGWALYDFRPDGHLRAQLIEAADLIVADVAAGRLMTSNYRFSMRALGRAYGVTGHRKYLDAARAWLRATDQGAALTGAHHGLGWAGWPGIATSAIPWIFPALDQEAGAGGQAEGVDRTPAASETGPPAALRDGFPRRRSPLRLVDK